MSPFQLILMFLIDLLLAMSLMVSMWIRRSSDSAGLPRITGTRAYRVRLTIRQRRTEGDAFPSCSWIILLHVDSNDSFGCVASSRASYKEIEHVCSHLSNSKS